MTLLDIMLERRSVRTYTGEPIPTDKLEKVLWAGLLAPTSMNRKPCEFYVVTDKEKLQKLSQSKKAGSGFLADASAAIVIFGDSNKADTWIEDCSAAMSYMTLMAVEQGLGCCWVQSHLRTSQDDTSSEDFVREILSVPENYRIVGMLSLGIPAKEAHPHSLSDLDYSKIHGLDI